MMTNKKNPIKNYIILVIIFIVTLVLTIYLLNWYRNYNQLKLNTPILSDTVAEVQYLELDAFLSERDITVVYMCTTTESKCRSFEKRFKHYIVNNNLRDEIFYFNIGDYTKDKEFLNNFYAKYRSQDLIKRITDYPVITVFKENKMIDVLSSTKDLNINIDDVDAFLADYVDVL